MATLNQGRLSIKRKGNGELDILSKFVSNYRVVNNKHKGENVL